jgi:hypothetical protein
VGVVIRKIGGRSGEEKMGREGGDGKKEELERGGGWEPSVPEVSNATLEMVLAKVLPECTWWSHSIPLSSWPMEEFQFHPTDCMMLWLNIAV